MIPLSHSTARVCGTIIDWIGRLLREQEKSIFGETIAPFKNPLAGHRMRYMIGASGDTLIGVSSGDIVVLPYDYEHDVSWAPLSYVGYCNLYWQEGAPDCGPYLESTETDEEYGERVIDPAGSGFLKNLVWQFERWQKIGVTYIELDNPDGYDIYTALSAITIAESYGLKVIAKNPGLFYPACVKYVARCHGIISENGAGDPNLLHHIRRESGFPDMPVWFVANGKLGEEWCNRLKVGTLGRTNMGVTLSRGGEYTEAEDIVVPHQ